jgi:hypothetical protein
MCMVTYTKTVRMEEFQHFLCENVPTSSCWPPRHNTPMAAANASRERMLFYINLLVEANRPLEAMLFSINAIGRWGMEVITRKGSGSRGAEGTNRSRGEQGRSNKWKGTSRCRKASGQI